MAALHIFLLPINLYGHLLPSLDMAKLLVTRGVKITVITTPSFTQRVERIRDLEFPEICVQCVPFPDEFRGSDDLSIPSDSASKRYYTAIHTLQEPVEKLIEEFRPDCLIADMFIPWASDAAAKFHIPRLGFNGTSLFAMCASENIRRNKPFRDVSSDTEPFLLPDFPHRVTFTRSELSPNDRGEIQTWFDRWVEESIESVVNGYGLIFNSFLELEPGYASYCRKVSGTRVWTIGPLFLCNEETKDGKNGSVHEDDCLKWLDSKKPDSVVYVSFGTLAQISDPQLQEIACALESSGQEFIWVVKKHASPEETDEKWLPERFEERTVGKGLIIRGWAPQNKILNHAAVGSFLTHCGWNSTLEAVCAGVPMITWPMFAEQFHNEKVVTDVLRVGVSIGNKKYLNEEMLIVKKETIAESLQRVAIGEEALELRRRVNVLKEMARQAIEPGGSSHSDLSRLLEELKAYDNHSSSSSSS